MEESKELQKMYGFFQALVYFLIVLEILAFVPLPLLPKQFGVFLERLYKIPMYQNIFYVKLGTLTAMIITCVGTKAKKDLDLDPVKHIVMPIFIGFMLFFGSAFLNMSKSVANISGIIRIVDVFYIIGTLIGAIMMHIGLDNISKQIKSGLMKDRFNIDNESFEQTTKCINTKYSVNIPMKFYFNKRWNKGWINIVNPFRGLLLIGTPGSGKTYSVINSYIRQLSMKGFALVVYDYKFPDLAKLTYHYFKKAVNSGVFPSNAKFHIIDFNKIEFSKRINPLKTEYIKSLADALETAEALVESLKKGNSESGGGAEVFFDQSAINFLAACIYFFSKHEGGMYSDLPHILAFMNRSYEEIFTVLYTNRELHSLLSPFQSAFEKKAWDQLEGQIGTLKIQTSRLATKESFWVFTEDPKKQPINLKVSDSEEPAYLIIANNPDTQNMNSALNALILNRLVRLINSKGNLPSAIIIDELPTIFFHKLANLMATARSNKVAVALGLQELPQLRVAYGKNGADEICSICGNILSGSARQKETLDWLEKLFGKVKQVKQNISIDRNRTTVSMNENMDLLIPGSKIANLQTGQLVGQVAKDFDTDDSNFVSTAYHCETTLDVKNIEKEENTFSDCKKIYNFGTTGKKEEILLSNYDRVTDEVENMIAEIL
ncbi:type IV secretory system conjugative DNA transfer family protein [Parabacteroides sp. PF5-9]|uniref:type IV secretory system conjugative DNA transfer family protein n=1 Tax=Parabacteroides sp. PF5-9 TaxID=1742404 RepID=UPI002475925C|nr:type IV secretory system conjugative DNA transfer family protein [Parabacteroides sp. PF5-9]MDH6358919.1 hypothetical protein [Parabacteroides sp. PF5-9]